MKKLNLILVLICLSLAARATVIFDRPADGSGALLPSSWVSPNGSDADVYTYDTFTVTNDAWLTEIDWEGGGGTSLDFWISIFDATHPVGNPQVASSAWLDYPSTGGNANQTSLGTVGATPMYGFKYILPTPVRITAGTYTMLIEDNSGSWGGIASGGSGTHVNFFTGLAMFLPGPGKTAFTLISTDTNYTVAVTSAPAGAGTVSGTGTFPVGLPISLTATPNSGYAFVKWTENGAQVSRNTNYNFTLATNRNFVAVFTNAATIAVTVSPANAGTVTGAGAFVGAKTVSLAATPAPGYNFVNWTENGAVISTTTNLSFTSSTNRNLVVNFTIAPEAAFFDFDSDTPNYAVNTYLMYYNLPLASRGLTANFFPSVVLWQIVTNIPGVTPGVPSNFSGKFLSPGYNSGSTMAIGFSDLVTNISLDFVTDDLSANVNFPTAVRLTAYTDSAKTNTVGWVTNAGPQVYNASYPEGRLTFQSGTPFSYVVIDIPPGQQLSQATAFWLDNVIVRRAVGPPFTVAVTASPSAGGTVTGGGNFYTNSTVSLTATASDGYTFSNWTENGVVVSAVTNYTFNVTAARTLVANYALIPLVLSPASAAPGSLGFTWTTSATGWVLQESPDLSPGSWTNSTLNVATSGGQNSVSTSPLTGNKFFRLYHP